MSDQERPAPPASGELPWVLEAMLFVSEEPLPISVMARAAGVGEGAVRRALGQLRADYEARGLRLQEDGLPVDLDDAEKALKGAIINYVNERDVVRASGVITIAE